VFFLPCAAEAECIDVIYDNGTLRITVPKLPATKAKKIQIASPKSAGRSEPMKPPPVSNPEPGKSAA
jgi:hypothetical protein